MSTPSRTEILNFANLDVFTETAYEGNPLALIRIPAALRHVLTQEKKQLIAREFNLSETVFLHENPYSEPKNEWEIDIFTTTAELPFAGHPTIGSACYVLNGLAGEGKGRGTFVTKAGRIPIALASNPGKMGGWGSVQADIPHDVHIHRHTLGDLENPIPGLSSNAVLAEAEKAAAIVSIVRGMTFLLVRLDTLEELSQVEVVGSKVSFHGLLDQGDGWDLGFVARYYYVVGGGRSNGMANEDGGATRIRTRMVEDTMEDPATGSAACALSAYLALQERRIRRFEVTQGVEMGRRSVIGVEVAVDSEGRRVQRVRLSGSSVQVMEGSLRI